MFVRALTKMFISQLSGYDFAFEVGSIYTAPSDKGGGMLGVRGVPWHAGTSQVNTVVHREFVLRYRQEMC